MYLDTVFIETTDTFHTGSQYPSPYSPNPTFNKKVSLWKGDITRLEIDAIVTSSGRGGVSNTIFKAAGQSLSKEFNELTIDELSPGEVKITGGHQLPAKCE